MWKMTPTLMRRLVAEMLGTAVLVIFGVGTVLAALTAGNGEITYPGVGFISLGFAIAVAVAIYAFLAVSGAHINPAVTFALAVTRRFPCAELVLYIVRPLETDRSFGVGPVRIPFPTLSWVGAGAYELPVGPGYRMFANDFLHWKWPHWFESAWDRYRVTAYLQLAQEDIVGDITWSAGGVTAEGVALTGFGLRSLGGGSFTRTVRH